MKSLIVWLVLLAVPFQGFASAAMLGCAPVKAGHGELHAHHAAAMPAMDHAHHGSHRADPAADDTSALGHKCSNCAACTVAAAMAPTLAALAAHAPPALSIALDDGPIPTVDLAHPERPPRFARA